jgi:hypothetical protein
MSKPAAREIAMTSLRNAAFAALLLTGAAVAPAHAFTVASPASLSGPAIAKADFSFADALAPARLDGSTAQKAAEDYFSFDALITFGALALAGGLVGGFFITAARRRAEELAKAEPAWRASVIRAVQADLADFALEYRRAA